MVMYFEYVLYCSAVQESRQTLRKTSSANVPLRRGALVRWTKRQKRNDPLKKAVTVRSDKKYTCPQNVHSEISDKYVEIVNQPIK